MILELFCVAVAAAAVAVNVSHINERNHFIWHDDFFLARCVGHLCVYDTQFIQLQIYKIIFVF